MEPVQGLNPNRRYISGLEPEMPVTSPNIKSRRMRQAKHLHVWGKGAYSFRGET
jgi:hypothetical protein